MADPDTQHPYAALGAWLGERLRGVRVSAAELARRMGVHHTAVVAWLDGRKRPSADRLGDLARALEMDAHDARRLYELAGVDIAPALPAEQAAS